MVEHFQSPLAGQKVVYYRGAWVNEHLSDAGALTGRYLRNPLAVGTMLRLLRFLEDESKDKWLSNLADLTKSNRKCVSMLAGLPEWQHCLFSLLSETLEQISARRRSGIEMMNGSHNSTENRIPLLSKRLDMTLHLYSTLLGHLLRSGGDQVSKSSPFCRFGLLTMRQVT